MPFRTRKKLILSSSCEMFSREDKTLERLLRHLLDTRQIDSWYYNGSYHYVIHNHVYHIKLIKEVKKNAV